MKKSQKKDVPSGLGIKLGTSHSEGHILTNCVILAKAEGRKNLLTLQTPQATVHSSLVAEA